MTNDKRIDDLEAHDRVLGILSGWATTNLSRNLRSRFEAAITEARQEGLLEAAEIAGDFPAGEHGNLPADSHTAAQEVAQEISASIKSAASRVLRNPRRSKKAMTEAGKHFTQRTEPSHD